MAADRAKIFSQKKNPRRKPLSVNWLRKWTKVVKRMIPIHPVIALCPSKVADTDRRVLRRT
jgi:hypothetical protein